MSFYNIFAVSDDHCLKIYLFANSIQQKNKRKIKVNSYLKRMAIYHLDKYTQK